MKYGTKDVKTRIEFATYSMTTYMIRSVYDTSAVSSVVRCEAWDQVVDISHHGTVESNRKAMLSAVNRK